MKKKISIIALTCFFTISSFSFASELPSRQEAQRPLQRPVIQEPVRPVIPPVQQSREEMAYLNQLQKVRRMIVSINDEQTKNEYIAKARRVYASEDTFHAKLEILRTMEREILAIYNNNQRPQSRDEFVRIVERSVELEQNLGNQRAQAARELLQQRKERLELQKKMEEAQKQALRQRALENRLFIRGQTLSYDVPPVIRENRTLVPVRAITEGLGAEVTYDPETRMVTIIRGDITINLVLGSTQVLVNGETRFIEVPAQLISNRTMVPLRFISEILGESVDYDEATGDIDIALDDLDALILIEESENL